MALKPFPYREFAQNPASPIVRAWFEDLYRSAATQVDSPTVDNFVSLDANGNMQDSGYDATSFGSSNAISGSTSGQKLRQVSLTIADGTNANTIKCTVANLYNGDTIAATDNISKGATTGNFTLNAGGTQLIVEKSGLSGNCLMAHGSLADDQTNTSDPTLNCYASGNDITIAIDSNGTPQDLTSLVDFGGGSSITAIILYLTDA